jgi:hypothetical protein
MKPMGLSDSRNAGVTLEGGQTAWAAVTEGQSFGFAREIASNAAVACELRSQGSAGIHELAGASVANLPSPGHIAAARTMPRDIAREYAFSIFMH